MNGKFFYTIILFSIISVAGYFEAIGAATDIQGNPHVVPTAYSNTTGTSTFTGPLANAQRTYQLLIHESELAAINGDRIEGITWRLPASATANWPLTDTTCSNFDIYLSGSVDPQNRSLTFANNIVGVQKLVRSGSIRMSAGSFTFGGSPNQFGREIIFDSAYLYNGGHLLIEIRHTGFPGTSRSVDAIGTSVSGYGTLFSACWTGSYTGTSGSQGNFSVISLTIGGIVGTHELTLSPERFRLEQNYPNPFNPVTRIKFEIPQDAKSHTSDVTLKIFNSLGREVKTMVSEKLNAGKYEAEFNAADFPGGVYFYELRVGEFVETKRMVLIK